MKFSHILFVILLMFAGNMKAEIKNKLAGAKASSYTIVYSSKAENEEGQQAAININNAFESLCGTRLNISSDKDFKKGNAILLIHTKDYTKPFEYSITAKNGKVTIDAGGCWAMERAGKLLAEMLSEKNVPSNFKKDGTVEGETLFNRPTGVNLRILDDNIWDYSSETLPPIWEKAGLECRDDHRAPQYAQLVRAFLPDVICLQEYNKHMHDRFYPLIQKMNFIICHEGDKDAWNNTPVFYNSENIEMVESKYNLFQPAMWCNGKTKSYTAAILRHKKTGEKFGVVSTHLWWKEEEVQAGSDLARAAQTRLIMAEVEYLRAKHHCPFFVMGDMNAEEKKPAVKQMLDYGYKQCYELATVYGNRDNGHHVCFPDRLGVRKSDRLGSDRKVGAIDQCLLYGGEDKIEIKVFDCIQPYFTVLLTDHYPNLIDAVIR